MGRILDFIENVTIVLSEPKDWKMTRIGNQTIYKGKFMVFDYRGKIRYRIHGRIVKQGTNSSEVYIFDPPGFVKNHRHGSCLQLLRPNDNWFKLHFEYPAQDFAGAYTYVEHLLSEALINEEI